MGGQPSKTSPNTGAASALSASTEPLFNSDQTPRPLRVLCIDGAGIRSYSSLIILEHLMARLPNQSGEPIYPANIFDLIIGTGTGGIIAVMLGRLKMSVPDCIKYFKEIMVGLLGRSVTRGVLSTGVRVLRGGDMAWISGSDVEAHLKRIISLQLGDPDSLMNEGEFEEDICKTAVVTTDMAGNEEPTILRSYNSGLGSSDEDEALGQVKIWEAARATSATPLIFEPIRIGGEKSYVDGAVVGHNNPAQLALEEVQGIWPGHPVGLFLSLGAGTTSGIKRNVARLASIFDRLATSAAQVDKQVMEGVNRQYGSASYIRLCPGGELASIGLNDHKAITGNHNRVQSITLSYLLQGQQAEKVTRCTALMTVHPSTQSSSMPGGPPGESPDPASECSPPPSQSQDLGINLQVGIPPTAGHRLSMQAGLGITQPVPNGIPRRVGVPQGRPVRPSSVSYLPTIGAQPLVQAELPGVYGNISTSPMPSTPQPYVSLPQVGPVMYMPGIPDNRSSQMINDHNGIPYGSPPNPFGPASASTSSPTIPLQRQFPSPTQVEGQGDAARSAKHKIDAINAFRSSSNRDTSTRPPENVIPTGTYQLTNIASGNEAALGDANHETNLVGASSDCDFSKIWNIEKLSNGRYTIKSVQHANYASHETRPKTEGPVYAKKDSKQWVIEESKTQHQYTIKCTEHDLFWGLQDSESKTPIVLRDGQGDKKNLWKFVPATIPDQPE